MFSSHKLTLNKLKKSMVESDYCSIDKSIGRSFISKSFDSDAIMISVTKPIKN